MVASPDGARSRFVAAGPTTAIWQGAQDVFASVVELQNVSFAAGRMVLHGLDAAEEGELRRLLHPYRHFVNDEIREDRFDDVVEFSPEPLIWSECDRVEDRWTFLLSPWHIDNAFHLHCDNLFPMFANVWSADLLDASRLLFLHPGDQKRNQAAALTWTLMDELFDGAVERFPPPSGGRVGMKRVRWGRGPLLPYLRDIRDTPYVGAVDAFRSWALTRFSIGERKTPQDGTDPTLLYLARSDERGIANVGVLEKAFETLGHTLRVFNAWSGTSVRDLVSLAHGTDVMLGVHGAALAYMTYMPKGSLVVELVPESHRDVEVYPHLSDLLGHRHVALEAPVRSTGSGRTITEDEAAEIAERVLHEWRERITTRLVTVRDLGKGGGWGTEVFRYMFGRCYARRYGLEFQADSWAGTELIGADDPPVRRDLPDVVEKTEHCVHDTIVPHSVPKHDVNFVGYFQYHTSHYRPDREFIRSIFQPAPEVSERISPYWRNLRRKGGTAVAVHVRRTDYGSGYFYRAPTAWYLELLESIWPSLDRPFLYVATDEPASVLEDFAQFEPSSASDLGPPWPTHDYYRDFYALQHCDVLAISNSTFSFSAAMLNTRLEAAFRPHLPTSRLVQFDPWNDKPLQQGRAFQVERYPWRPEVWAPGPIWTRWGKWAQYHSRWAWASVATGSRRVLRSIRSRTRWPGAHS